MKKGRKHKVSRQLKNYHNKKKELKHVRLKVNYEFANDKIISSRRVYLESVLEKIIGAGSLGFKPRKEDYKGMQGNVTVVVIPIKSELYAKFEKLTKGEDVKTNQCLALALRFNYNNK